MIGEGRRLAILARLTQADAPISASCLAAEFSVTRQIIVADIALLRAAGNEIRAVHKGYLIDKPDGVSLFKKIVVKHGKEDVAAEFYAIVDNGGRVLDVIVEHSVYGQISAALCIASRYDADAFVEQISTTGANPLSLLTEGLHIHTVAVRDEASFVRICDQLSKLGILIEAE